jgi:hypothetical protein
MSLGRDHAADTTPLRARKARSRLHRDRRRAERRTRELMLAAHTAERRWRVRPQRRLLRSNRRTQLRQDQQDRRSADLHP